MADFVASFAAIPDDYDHRRLGQQPRAYPTTPVAAPFQKECGKCHVIDGFTEGGLRDAPGSLAGDLPGGSPG